MNFITLHKFRGWDTIGAPILQEFHVVREQIETVELAGMHYSTEIYTPLVRITMQSGRTYEVTEGLYAIEYAMNTRSKWDPVVMG